MTRWDLVGRDDLLDDLVVQVRAGRSLLVRGPRGSGRSSVLAALAERIGASHRCLSVSGRERQEGVAFLPWAATLDTYGARPDEPLTFYTQVPRRIAGDVDLVLVDDLELLDAGSALLLVQLVRLDVAVVATTTGGDLPDSLRDVATRWHTSEVPRLHDDQIESIAAAVAGAPLVAPTAAQLVAWSRGLPAAAVTLVVAAQQADRVRHSPAGAQIVEPVVPDRLLGLLGLDAELGHRHRDVLDVVAVAGRLPSGAVDAEEVALLSRGGWLDIVAETVSVAHPLVTAWCLHALTPSQRRSVYAAAAELVGSAEQTDRLLSHLRVCSGAAADPLDTVAAACWLLDQNRHPEAVELLDAIATPTDAVLGWLSSMAKARVHRDLGQRLDALAALDAAVPYAVTDEQQLELVQRWEALHGGWLTDDAALADRVTRLITTAKDPSARDGLVAVLERRRAILGERRDQRASKATGAEGGKAQPSPDPVVTLLREAMGGSLELARAHFVPPAEADVHDDEDLDELLQVLGRFLGLVYNGDLVEGRAEADHRHARALREARPSLGLWSYNRTKIAFHAGEYQLAVARGREMRRHLAWRDVAGQGLPGEALYAGALARAGQLPLALDLVSPWGTDELALPRVRLGAHRVRAEDEMAAGRTSHAAALLHEAGQYALENGEGHSGLLALDEAYTLEPSREHADTLIPLAGMSAIAAASADRARADQAGDSAALADVGDRFLSMPLYGRAAQCWEAAARLHESAGHSEQGRRLRARATVLRSDHGLTPWPRTGPGALTTRELEIARLAAQRVRSKEIADRLGLSVRTVDNHLAAAYRKLEVSGRDGLAAVLDH